MTWNFKYCCNWCIGDITTNDNRPSRHSLWLAAAGWSGKATEVPRAHRQNIPQTRHDHHLWALKTSDHADSTEEANKTTWAKYQEFVEECMNRGWKTSYEPGPEASQDAHLAKSLCGQEEGHSNCDWSHRKGGFGLRGRIHGLLLGEGVWCYEIRNTRGLQDTLLMMWHIASWDGSCTLDDNVFYRCTK